jgi:uncharacterized protein
VYNTTYIYVTRRCYFDVPDDHQKPLLLRLVLEHFAVVGTVSPIMATTLIKLLSQQQAAVGRAVHVAELSSTTVRRVSSRSNAHMAAAAPPVQYLLKYDYIPNVLEKRGPFREKHLELAKQMIAAGKCLSGGPTTPAALDAGVATATATSTAAAPTGALFIFTEQHAAQQFVNQDPYVSNGIVTGHVIEEWNVVIQKE